MSIKNILTMSFVVGLIFLSGSAALIVDPHWWCVTATGGAFIPEALQECQ
jgi:hypothetical protein